MIYETIRRRPWQGAVVALASAAALLPGCSAPAVEGLQVQEPPAGFFFDANASKGRAVFPEREILSQGAWWGDIRSEEPRSDIFVTRYPGGVTAEDAQAARDRQAARYGGITSTQYGAVTALTIDARSAFAWLEQRLDENGDLRGLDYKALITYDSVTYAVEFSTSAEHRLHPDSVARVVHSFGMGTTTVHWNMIVGSVLVLGGLLVFLVGRARRPRHLTSYPLWDGTAGDGGASAPGHRAKEPE